MRLNSFIKIVVLFSLIFIFYGCGKREPVVALIDNQETITLAEFQNDFKQGKSKQKIDSAEYSDLTAHLDKMIGGRLVTVAAYEIGLDKDSTIAAKMEPFRIQTLLTELHKMEVMNHIIKESDYRNFYANTAKEVLLRTIFFALPRNVPPEKEKEVRARALIAIKRIGAGEDYEKIAKELSEDPDSAPSGGRLGYVTWDRSDDPIKKGAWRMKTGQISDLIRNNTGFHILRVDDIRNAERKPFEVAKKEIDGQLRMERGSQIGERTEAYWQKVMKKNNIKWREEEINRLLSCLGDVPQPMCTMLYDTLLTWPPEKKTNILVTHKKGEVTIQELEGYLPRIKRRTKINSDMVKLIISDNIFKIKMLMEQAVQLGIDKEKKVAPRLKRSLEWYMREKFLRDEIYKELEPTEKDLRDYYERSKKEKFFVEEKVNVREIMVKDELLAKEIALMARKGQNFEKLAAKYTERRGYKKKKGELGFFRRIHWGAVGRKAFDLKVGEITGPFPLDNNQGHSVIQLLDRQPSHIKLFNDVKKTVRIDLIKEMKKDLEEAWASKKRETVRVLVFEDVLEKALDKI